MYRSMMGHQRRRKVRTGTCLVALAAWCGSRLFYAFGLSISVAISGSGALFLCGQQLGVALAVLPDVSGSLGLRSI
jgi:hypothetical protein